MLSAIITLGGILYLRRDPPNTVPLVNLNKYAGIWYQISNYPQFYELIIRCNKCVKANYTLNSDGTLGIENTCKRSNGITTGGPALAKSTNSPANSRLSIDFNVPFA